MAAERRLRDSAGEVDALPHGVFYFALRCRRLSRRSVVRLTVNLHRTRHGRVDLDRRTVDLDLYDVKGWRQSCRP